VSERANPTLIGAFLLGAIALVVTGLMVFGGGRFFTEKVNYVAYFPETVSGLNDGAPVNFRGVKVGTVRRIEVQFNAQDLSVRIPVYLQLERKRIREIGGTIPEINFIPELIERGLRAQLQLQSIVTGQLSVQLDIHPNRPARFVDPVGEFPEMPTIPSSMQEFTETIESLSIQDMVNDARQVLAGLKILVNSPELAELLTGVNEFVNSGELLGLVTHTNEAIDDVQALVSNIDGRVGENPQRRQAGACNRSRGFADALRIRKDARRVDRGRAFDSPARGVPRAEPRRSGPRKTRRILMLLLTGCLLGRGTTRTTRLFVLNATATPADSSDDASDLRLGIGRILLPEFLNRPQIVTRTGGNRVRMAGKPRATDRDRSGVRLPLAHPDRGRSHGGDRGHPIRGRHRWRSFARRALAIGPGRRIRGVSPAGFELRGFRSRPIHGSDGRRDESNARRDE